MRVIWTGLIIFLLASCGEDSLEKNGLYSRSDCIVKFQIDMDELSRDEVRELYDALSYFIRSEAAYPMAGMTFPNSTREFFYVQLSDSCDSRLEITEAMVKRFVSARSQGFNYQVFPDVVCPSPNTISMRGPSWNSNDSCK